MIHKKIKPFILPLLLVVLIIFAIGIYYNYQNNTDAIEYNFTAEERAWIKKHPTLTLSPDPIYHPIEFIDKRGNYKGLAADYIAWINENSPLTIEIERSEDWNAVLEKLRNKTIDLSGAATPTDKRKEFMIFSETLISIPNVIITKQSVSQSLKLSDLKNMDVAVVENYATYDYLSEHYEYINLIPVKNTEQGIKKVSFNLADAFVGDMGQISYFIDETKITNLTIVSETEFKYDLAIGVRDDYKTLVPIINKILDKMPQEKREQIKEKWVSTSSFAEKQLRRNIIKSSIVIFFVISFFVLNNIYLSKQVKEKTNELNQSNKQLLLLNENLESLVDEKTKEIKMNQKKLFELEKVKLQSDIILGIAHEINTPIGNSLTASSHLKNLFNKIKKQFAEDDYDKNRCQQLLGDIIELNDLTLNNLKQTSKIVQSFKKVASFNYENKDQYINLYNHLHSILLILLPSSKMKNVHTTIHCDKNIHLKVNTDYLLQIISNLVFNSIRHGFKDRNSGNIEISAFQSNEEVKIIYVDDGKGVSKEHQSKIFIPFFTTDNANIGLGLNIVEKLLVEKMNGSIEYIPTTVGVKFIIKIKAPSL